MFHKLEEVEARHAELTARLADPEIVQDADKLRIVSKERADLDRVVECYQEFKRLREQFVENKALLDDADDDLRQMAKEEDASLRVSIEELQHQLEILLLPKDPNDDKNVILEIRAGTGGDEASLFAGELYRMYTQFAQSKGFRVEEMSISAGSQGGVKEAIAMISGDAVYSQLKYESGVHRVQRVPATEAQGRIHTSAVTVAVLPEAEEVEVDIRPDEVRIDVYRSSGPGGQSVNTTDSAVRITHLATGLKVACQDEKSQHKNKAKGMRILRARLFDKMQQEQHDAIAEERRGMVGSGDRSEKIRTYNFPQDRLTDHRIGLTVHNLPKLLSGDLEGVVVSLRTHFEAEALKAASSAAQV